MIPRAYLSAVAVALALGVTTPSPLAAQAQTESGPSRAVQEVLAGAGLGGGAYEELSALLEVTIFGIDVLHLTVRVDAGTGARLRRVLPGRSYGDAAADSVAAAVLGADELWARQILVRDVSHGRLVGGIRETTERAVRAGWVSAEHFERFSAEVPELFGFLREDGAKEGDEIFFHSLGDTVRTVYRTVDGRVLLDRRVVDAEARRAAIPSFFAPGSRFRERLVKSVLETEALPVPRFAEDDERVGTTGFVAETTRVQREVDDAEFALMTFVVGDVLTLGAMVEGDFDGTAAWTVGGRSFTVPLSRANRGRGDVPTSLPGLAGEHGGFDAFDWVNVEVPVDEWLPNGTPVSLRFTPASGEGPGPARVPEEGWLVSSVVER